MNIKSRIDYLEKESKNFIKVKCPDCKRTFLVKIPENHQANLNVVYDNNDIKSARDKLKKAIEIKVEQEVKNRLMEMGIE